MMGGIYTTRPIKEIGSKAFRRLLKGREIAVSSHALDHIERKERKIFKEEELIRIAGKDNPRKCHLQENGRYSAYYRKPGGYTKIVIELENDNAVIVSFMNVIELPKIR
ncbi:hypothetical protein GF345_06170 [Candidatus Woesearchaeota archaeon]|nr:hypothetical protein [Candidatus Woesearchaeota archaeon]